MESMHFYDTSAIIEDPLVNPETCKNSEDILKNIHVLLNSFTEPNPDLITEAKKYIEALRQEGVPKTADTSEPFKKSLLQKLYKKFHGCVGCGGGVMGASSRNDNLLQPHHILPSEFGGKALSENAMIVCRNCHIQIHK